MSSASQSSSFSDLGIPADVVSSLNARRITEAFPIQTMAIPPAMKGLDVCGKAPTGSGKTLAFGIPLAHRVGRGRVARPKALVLAPTRELAAQISEELELLLKPKKGSVATFYGGVGFGNQLKVLRRGVDVAVACPGRLMDLMNRGNIKLDEVEIVVIDEADRMADMGFLPEVKRILDQVRSDRQTLLFSATLDGDVDVLIKRYQQNPVRCEVAPHEDEGKNITHHFMNLQRDQKIMTAADVVDKNGSTIIFCRTKHGSDRVARQLKRAGVSAVAIHGGRSQSQRDRALSAFHEGQVQALVATDVAARGIHVDNVGCVLHFDPAQDHKDYVHRSGRTGRAGADGIVISFVSELDRDKVKKLRRNLEVDVASDDLKPSTKSLPKPKGGSQGSNHGGSGSNNGSSHSKSKSRKPNHSKASSGKPGSGKPSSGKPGSGKPKSSKPGGKPATVRSSRPGDAQPKKKSPSQVRRAKRRAAERRGQPSAR